MTLRGSRKSTKLSSNILLEGSKELGLLLAGLEATTAEFRRGIDPFEIDLLQSLSAGVVDESFSEGENSLLDTWARTLEHNEVVRDRTISDETTHWSNGLVRDIVFGGSVVWIRCQTNSVNLVI